MRHRRRKDEHVPDRVARQRRVHPPLQPRIMEIAERQRLPGPYPQQRLEPLRPRIDLDAGQIDAQRSQFLDPHKVIGVIHQAPEMHAEPPRQMLEHVPGADFVPLVRRVGDAMGKKQQVMHCITNLMTPIQSKKVFNAKPQDQIRENREAAVVAPRAMFDRAAGAASKLVSLRPSRPRLASLR
jgi:hypothetical protein